MVGAERTGPESIGQRLRRLRLERNLSQRELSSPGVSYAYISRIEAEARRPSVKALRQLAPKLGVSVEYLETGSDLREVDERELRLADAELKLRLADDPGDARDTVQGILDDAIAAGDSASALRARVALGLAEARAGNNTAAVASGLERSGRLITGAAAIMVGVFIAFALADVVIIKSVGLGLAIAVALDATLVRALVVPATMRLLGRANWWAPWRFRRAVRLEPASATMEA